MVIHLDVDSAEYILSTLCIANHKRPYNVVHLHKVRRRGSQFELTKPFVCFKTYLDVCPGCQRGTVNRHLATVPDKKVQTNVGMHCCGADSWPSALALLAGPKAAPSSLELLNQLIDEARPLELHSRIEEHTPKAICTIL